ncbi:EcsC family protein [Entomobacter blattae]|uniref:EcsC protein family protein n=1 Tax=Entomobacter blattae TaxID=2762277 RepID=A0A7H1NNI4_9PROT|nr:EcsC family protein [Entomobacter blattae]QNT77344.1 EcsC protein family protein [Entomobacter blattae]
MQEKPSNDASHKELTESSLTVEDLSALEKALEDVEQRRNVLVRLADLMGGAVGHMASLGMQGISMAPAVQKKLQGVVQSSLSRAFDVAVIGVKHGGKKSPAKWREPFVHAAVVASGVAGGFVGAPGLVPDIGFTTLTIMREIARIAQEEGEDLKDPETRRACLEVFALRSLNQKDSSEREIGFFSARTLLRGRPLIMLVSEVAGHYGLALSRKISLQMTPIAGALCGAALNAAFLAHYKALARAHFVIRRLERERGELARNVAHSVYTAHQEKWSEKQGKDTPFS